MQCFEENMTKWNHEQMHDPSHTRTSGWSPQVTKMVYLAWICTKDQVPVKLKSQSWVVCLVFIHRGVQKHTNLHTCTNTHTSNPPPLPYTRGYFQGKPRRVLASVVVAKGWDQTLVFVFPDSASDVHKCVCVSLGVWSQISLYLSLSVSLYLSSKHC